MPPRGRPKAKPFAHHKTQEDIVCDEPKKSKSEACALGRGLSTTSVLPTAMATSTLELAQAAIAGVDALRVELSRRRGRELEECDSTGATALMLALDDCPLKDVREVVTLLLSHGADPNATDLAGDSPLIYCIQRDSRKASAVERPIFLIRMVDCVKLLLDHRANPLQCNRRSQQNPLEISENFFGAIGKGTNTIGEAMEEELSLRKVEEGLPDWNKTQESPVIPESVHSALAIGRDRGHHRVSSHLDAYCKAVEVLQTYGEGLRIEFQPDSVGFVPASSKHETVLLRKALEAADLYLRLYGQLPGPLGNMVFEGLLPLQANVFEQYLERYSSPSVHASLIDFLSSKREKYLHGYDWAFKELIEKQEAEGLAAVISLVHKFPSGKGPDKPRQQTNVLSKVMADASVAQRRVLLLAAAAAQHANATHLVVKSKSGEGRVEPKQKRLFRSYEKVWLGTGPEGLLDVARGGVECPSMSSVQKALQYLLDESERGELRLLRIKPRFEQPSDGGWRDALVNFMFPDDPAQHVCELQIMHEKLMTIRADMGAHHDYAQFRGVAELLEIQDIDWIEEVKKRSSGGTDPSKRIAELEAALLTKDQRIAELEAKVAAFQASTTHGTKERDSANVMSVFQSWDTDGSGYIDRKQMAQVLKNLGKMFTDQELDALFAVADKNHDGKVDYEEFVTWMFDSK